MSDASPSLGDVLLSRLQRRSIGRQEISGLFPTKPATFPTGRSKVIYHQCVGEWGF